jgi:hypothetical protein
MDAPRPPSGALAPRAPHSPAPEMQLKSRQQKLFSFFRRAKKRANNRQNGSIINHFCQNKLKNIYFGQNGSIKQIFSPAETKAMGSYGIYFTYLLTGRALTI